MILGGAVFMPFVVLTMFLTSWVGNGDGKIAWYIPIFVLLVLLAELMIGGLMPAVRAIEGATSRELLGAPDVLGQSTAWSARWRAAAWFVVHMLAGGVVGVLSLLIPSGTVWTFVVPFNEEEAGKLPDWLVPVAPAGGLIALILFVYGLAFLGEVAARVAPHALGPTPEERVEAAEKRADAQAERTRLARELHDSVGHALSVVTLQSAAAARVLDHDPEFAKLALNAIEESARTALEDLDHVLGLLREEENARRTPQRTLKDLDDLISKTGLAITVKKEGELDRLPAAVSREAYRIIQEGLTNVAKHAGHVPVDLRLSAYAHELDLELANPMGARTHGKGTGGRGLDGLRERVGVLRGHLTACADGNDWRVRVTIPITRGTV